jgi:ATP-dependent RNA helicase DeaD
LLPDNLPSPLAKALAERGYTDLTPVQSAVAATDADGRDLLVSARTGSGKTVAFGLGIAPTLLAGAERFDRADLPLALVIAPTRELAMQVQRELEWLYAPAGGRIIAVVGGMDPRRERRQLEAGCHIVVGTPGRLRDHVERKALDLSGIAAVVLDEADEMLDMGFKEDLTFLLDAAPDERRTLLFSATIPKEIAKLAQDFQRDAFRIAAASGETGHADIAYVAMQVGPRDGEKAVVNILREKDAEAAIIFCRTRESVKRLHALLSERGFTAVCLSGELSQGERNHALQALRDGRAKVCVATDVAARGIDLPHLSLVIHADLPTNAEVLQHRSGRTGRAGRKGESVLLVPPSRRRLAERLLAEAKVKPTWAHPPDADTIRARDRERFLKDPLLLDETTDDDRAMGAALLRERPAEEIAAILARLYRSRLPEPEDLAPPMQDRFEDRSTRQRGERFEKRAERFPDRRQDERGQDERGARRHPAYAPQARESAPVEARGRSAGGVTFRLDVGRKHRADPKWLLPMVCRRGDVSRNAIGTFRILEDSTEFEVSAAEAEHFATSAARKDADNIRVTRLDGPSAQPRGEFRKPREDDRDGGRPPFRPGFKGKKAFDKKPFDKKPFDKKPWGKRNDDVPPSLAEAVPYEMRKPYAERQASGETARPAGRDEGSRDATKTDYPSRKRFMPTGADRGNAGTPKHSRTGFQHRKGQKGKQRD